MNWAVAFLGGGDCKTDWVGMRGKLDLHSTFVSCQEGQFFVTFCFLFEDRRTGGRIPQEHCTMRHLLVFRRRGHMHTMFEMPVCPPFDFVPDSGCDWTRPSITHLH